MESIYTENKTSKKQKSSDSRSINITSFILTLIGIILYPKTLALFCHQEINLFLNKLFLSLLSFFSLGLAITNFALRSQKRILINIYLSLSVLLLTLVVTETYFRFFNPQFIEQYHQLFTAHPTYGWQFKPNHTQQIISPLGETRQIKTNSLGLRDKEYSKSKVPDKKRIIILGDSFVSALSVSSPEIFTEILEEKLLKNTEVLNFGVDAFSPWQELLILKNLGIDYDPDIAIMMIYIRNDFRDLLNKNFSDSYLKYQRPQAELHQQQLITNPKPLTPSSLDTLLRSLFPRLHLVKFFLSQAYIPEIFLCHKTPDKNTELSFRLMKATIQQTSLFCRQHNINFILVIAPSKIQIYEKLYWKKFKKLYNLKAEEYDLFLPNKILSNIAKEYNIPCLDLTDTLKQHSKQQLYYQKDVHWTPQGHYIVAQAIAQYLKTYLPLPSLQTVKK